MNPRLQVGMRVTGDFDGVRPAAEGTVVEVGELDYGNGHTARVHWDGEPTKRCTSEYNNYWQIHLRLVPCDPDAPD